MVQEISSASSEQNSGASQINQSLQQLDQVIQRNAGASEEMAATAEELSSQSASLQETMAFFRLSDGAHAKRDQNAAKNVLSRLHDTQIGRWTNFKKVKSILIERFSRPVETVPPGLELQPV